MSKKRKLLSRAEALEELKRGKKLRHVDLDAKTFGPLGLRQEKGHYQFYQRINAEEEVWTNHTSFCVDVDDMPYDHFISGWYVVKTKILPSRAELLKQIAALENNKRKFAAGDLVQWNGHPGIIRGMENRCVVEIDGLSGYAHVLESELTNFSTEDNWSPCDADTARKQHARGMAIKRGDWSGYLLRSQILGARWQSRWQFCEQLLNSTESSGWFWSEKDQ